MKVYAVYSCGEFDGPVTCSIWSTREKAELEVVRLFVETGRDEYGVQEWLVDEESEKIS